MRDYLSLYNRNYFPKYGKQMNKIIVICDTSQLICVERYRSPYRVIVLVLRFNALNVKISCDTNAISMSKLDSLLLITGRKHLYRVSKTKESSPKFI